MVSRAAWTGLRHRAGPPARRLARRVGLMLAVMLAATGTASLRGASTSAAPTADPMLRIDTPMHQALIRRLVVGANGDRLVTAGDDKSIRIWHLGRGSDGARQAHLMRTLRVPSDAGHEGQLFALAMSPDGRRIAAGGWTCWDWERAGCVYVFDAETGELLRRLRGLPDAVGALAWSPDGRHLAVGLQGRGGLRVLRTDTFAQVAVDLEYGDKLMELAYASDGRLAAVSLDGRVRLYRPDHRLHGRVTLEGGQPLASVRVDPTGRWLAAGLSRAPVVVVLDAATLTLRARHRADDPAQHSLSSVAFSPDGSQLIAAGERSGGGTNALLRWPAADDASRGPPQRLAVPAQRISDLQTLPDGSVAYAAEDPRLGIVNPQGRLVLDRPAEIADFSVPGFTLRVSRDGTTVSHSGPDGQPRTFTLGAALRTAAPPPSGLAGPTRSAAGWQIATASDGRSLMLQGRPVPLDDHEQVRTHALSPVGDALVVGTEWGLRRFDRSGAQIWRVRLSAIVRELVVSGDGQWVVAALADGTLRWFRARDGVEALAYFAHANGEDWIAWTPAGYYMSSLQGDQFVGWQLNRGGDTAPDFFRAVQFERVLYRPDLVAQALGAAAAGNVRGLMGGTRLGDRLDANRLAPLAPPRLAVRTLGTRRAPDGSLRARLRVSAERGAQPLSEITVYVNEVPVTRADDRGVGWMETERLERDVEVVLSATTNEIRVESATSVSMGVATGFIGLDAQAPPAPVQGDLWVLAIGNNRFPQLPPATTLEYAARDAQSLADALASRGSGLYRRVHVEVLADGQPLQAERQAVLQALGRLRRARAEDTVVVFLASHGVSDRSGNYWFVPRDARRADLEAVEKSSPGEPARADSLISWTAFFDALRLAAGRRLLIVDTCQAKGIEGRFESFSLMKRSAASRFSMMVASQSNEESQEYPPAGHGLFTYGLLRALGAATTGSDPAPGPADTNGDGVVSIAEAFAAAAPLVERLHDRALGPQTPALIAPAALADAALAAVKR